MTTPSPGGRGAALRLDHHRPRLTLRSGAIGLSGRPVGAGAQLRHRRAGGRFATVRHRPRRRGRHTLADVFAAPKHDRQVGATRVRRVELASRNLDFDAVERAITPRTKAIMPTHFAGLPVDMDRLYTIAGGMGCGHRGRGAGDQFELAWSADRRVRRSYGVQFPSNKNMTTIEGGALVLPSEERRARPRPCASTASPVCRTARAMSPFPAANSTCPTSTPGARQLARLEEFNARRRELVADYFRLLHADPPCLLPHPASGDEAGHS